MVALNQTIDGRVVKVNGVRTRGGRSVFGREHVHHSTEKNGDWDHGRDRDRDYGHDKDGHRNRNSDWLREGDRPRERDRSREHDRSRNFEHDGDRRYERTHFYDQAREPSLDKDWNQEGHHADDEQEYGRHATEEDYNLDLAADRKMDRANDPDSLDGDRNEHSRRNSG